MFIYFIENYLMIMYLFQMKLAEEERKKWKKKKLTEREWTIPLNLNQQPRKEIPNRRKNINIIYFFPSQNNFGFLLIDWTIFQRFECILYYFRQMIDPKFRMRNDLKQNVRPGRASGRKRTHRQTWADDGKEGTVKKW